METRQTHQQTNIWSKKTPAFVISAFVIVVLITIAAISMFELRRAEQDGMSGNEYQSGDIASTTTNIGEEPVIIGDGPSYSTEFPTNNSNSDDSNGSGQAVQQDEIPSTGWQSPISVHLYYKHIVGGDTKNPSVDKQVQIKPWAVLEDSRCAADVQCVWAGRVRVGVQFTDAETGSELIPSPVMEPGQSATVRNMKITLLEVKPENKAGVKIQDEQYRFVFSIEKLSN